MDGASSNSSADAFFEKRLIGKFSWSMQDLA